LHNYFKLSFGPRVHFRGQKLILCSNKKVFFTECPLVKLSYFTLEKSFFLFITNFFPLISKLATVARGHPKTIRTRSLIRKLGFGGFSKKNRNKTFYFYTKKKYCIIILYFVLALESISGVKSWLCAEIKKFSIQSAHLSNYHISLWRKVFFSFITNFFPLISKLATVARGHQKQ
jgi:hypothetical protein